LEYFVNFLNPFINQDQKSDWTERKKTEAVAETATPKAQR